MNFVSVFLAIDVVIAALTIPLYMGSGLTS